MRPAKNEDFVVALQQLIEDDRVKANVGDFGRVVCVEPGLTTIRWTSSGLASGCCEGEFALAAGA